MNRIIVKYKKDAFEECKRVLPVFGISVSGESLDDMKLCDMNGCELLRMGGSFSGPNLKVSFGYLYIGNFNIFVTDLDKGITFEYTRNPLDDYYLVDTRNSVSISKMLADGMVLQTKIKNSALLSSAGTDISIRSFKDGNIQLELLYAEIYHEANNSKLYLFDDKNGTQLGDAADVIANIKCLLSDVIDKLSASGLLNFDSDSVKEAIAKGLLLVEPGITRLTEKMQENGKNTSVSKNNISR